MGARGFGVGFYAPSGFAVDPAALERAVVRIGARGHGVVVDPGCRDRWQRFAATDDERLAAVLRMAGDPRRRTGDRAARRLRLDAPARPDLDFDALAPRTSAGWATAISPPSSWRRWRGRAW